MIFVSVIVSRPLRSVHTEFVKFRFVLGTTRDPKIAAHPVMSERLND